MPEPTTPKSVEGTAPRRGAGRGRAARFLRAFMALAARLALGLVVCLVVAGLYLAVIGLPRPLVRRMVEGLRASGVNASLGRVRLDPVDGIVAHDVRVFDRPGAAVPTAEADSVNLGIDLRQLLRRQPALREVRVRGGAFRVGTRGPLTSADDPRNLALEAIEADVELEPGLLRVHGLAASLAGIRVEGNGLIRRRRVVERAATFEEVMRDMTARLAAANMAWVSELMEELNATVHDLPPRAEIQFEVGPKEEVTNEVRLAVAGQGARFRGAVVDGWRIEAGLSGGRVDVPVLEIRQGERIGRAKLSLDMESRQAMGEVSSSLSPECIAAFLPRRWLGVLEQQSVLTGAVLDVQATFGPADAGEVLRHAEGRVALRRAEVRGVWVESAFAEFVADGEKLNVTAVDAVLGRDRQQGRLGGQAWYGFMDKRFGGHARTTFDPHAMLSILSSNQAEVVRRFDFPAGPPQVELDFQGLEGHPQQFAIEGDFHGSNFAYRGVSVSSLDTTLALSNGVMRMDPYLLVREEGRGEGWLRMDFDRGNVTMDMVSTCDPKAVAQMIGPALERALGPFSFEGPTRVAVKGRVDYARPERTKFDGTAEAERMVLQGFMADRCTFRMEARGERLDIMDIAGTAYGGTFDSTTSVYAVEGETNAGYDVYFKVAEADFRGVMAALGVKDVEQYEGRLSVSITVKGLMGEGQGETAVGRGQVRIREGRLFQIPLLGGLSRFIARIQPGWGYAEQTDFSAGYRVQDGRIESDDISLQGGLVTVKARGACRLDQRLSFVVQLHFLRGSKLGDIVNLVTFPLTKLFEFHLGGHVGDPKWRPINFPKELFLIFD